MTSRTHILLWTDAAAAYLEAIEGAGLAGRVAVDTLPRKEKPSAELMARTEALMAYGVPPGVLPAMPKLRWAQAMTAGVEGWLSLPDLPAGLTLTCARGTHRESMPENIIGALFYVAKPYATAVANQKRGLWVQSVAQPLEGKTLGILGLGAIGQMVARIAASFGMRVIGTRRRPEPMADGHEQRLVIELYITKGESSGAHSVRSQHGIRPGTFNAGVVGFDEEGGNAPGAGILVSLGVDR